MALITDLPAASSLATTDLLIKDTGSATQKIAISDAYATASQPGLVSNTLQDFGGYKFFCQTSANAASIGFKFTDKSNAVYGQILQSYGSGSPNMQFRQMSVDSSGNALTYHDSYRLPAATVNKASNSSYDIITTKTEPTHTQIATNFTLTAWWNVVTLDFNGFTPSASTYTTLAAAYRPNYTAHGICRWNNGTNYYPALITILSTGVVSGSYFNPNTGTATSISSGTLVGSITFVAK